MRKLARIGFIGLCAATSPILLYLIWEIKVVLGFVFGLPLAAALLLLTELQAERRATCVGSYSVALLAVGAQLTAIQFIQPLTGLELTRAIRIWVLAAVVVVGVVSLGLASLLAVRKSDKE